MKLPSKERFLWPALTGALVAILLLLGTLQYRWSIQVSEATRARMQAGLDSSMLAFRQDFARDLSELTLPFEPALEPGQPPELTTLAHQTSQMRRTATHAALVKAVYVAEQTPSGQFRLLKESAGKAAFEPAAWPGSLKGLRTALPQPLSLRVFSRRPPRDHERDHYRMQSGFGPRMLVQKHGPPWFIAALIPALVRPVEIHFGIFPPRPDQSRQWIIIELDRRFLQQHLFPELVSRYFPNSNEQNYDVAIASGTSDSDDIYRSGAHLTEKRADAAISLFGGPPRSGDSVSLDLEVQSRNKGLHEHEMELPLNVPLGLEPGRPFEASNWVLLVKNRQGSLEAAVARLRLRNLTVSFGILLVLAATMAVVVLASQRARRLAQLQMDFVAGVSHELRTPITVISSAAENIADGLIEDKDQIARYGTAIKNQATQLKQLVEQILLFASSRHGKPAYSLRPANVEDVIEGALANSADLIRSAAITVERSLQSKLPAIAVDTQALSQCLQNLIANAVKYRGDVPWIGIAAAARRLARDMEVVITVSDRGIGIDPDELPHVFDPFYRATAVREAQIHGNGLGLPLAKSMAEAMGGYITVQSKLGAGSAFSVHLPAASVEVAARVIERAPAKDLLQNHE
ncbi:MAG TPA: HAMP domain-containing sensor histidine kinase [Terriglobales bacterium]|nr:HAMP domain-containing sensor histidine kinase [Terriglobales bacterium]